MSAAALTYLRCRYDRNVEAGLDVIAIGQQVMQSNDGVIFLLGAKYQRCRPGPGGSYW